MGRHHPGREHQAGVKSRLRPTRRAGAAEVSKSAMAHDVKELIGILMRVLDNAEITEDEVHDLEFEAEGELLTALNDTFVELLAFVHDRERRLADPGLDQRERALLQDCLNRIVTLCDRDAA